MHNPAKGLFCPTRMFNIVLCRAPSAMKINLEASRIYHREIESVEPMAIGHETLPAEGKPFRLRRTQRPHW